jgi:hypothetical protein
VVSRDLKDSLEFLGSLDQPGYQEQLVCKEVLVVMGRWDPRVSQASLGPVELPVPQVRRASSEILVYLARLELQEILDSQG